MKELGYSFRLIGLSIMMGASLTRAKLELVAVALALILIVMGIVLDLKRDKRTAERMQ